MLSRRRVLMGLLPGLCCLPMSGYAQGAITYHVQPLVSQKQYQIKMDVPGVKELTVRVQMPVWMPGAYFIGNFANNIGAVTAADAAHRPLRVFHPDQNTWEIAANGAHTVSVTYVVNNADLEEAHGAPRRGHISGPRTYMYVVGRKTEQVELELLPPSGATVWNIATSLDPVVVPETVSGSKSGVNARTTFRAPGYDVLADAPVEMGDFLDEQFTAGGKPHHVVMYGDYKNTNKAKLTEFCKRIAETEISFFGGAPFERYIFEFNTTSAPSRGAGGLEHLGSTEIGTVGEVTDSVRSVIAHEYFHLWNVKRIRPFVLGPFNYVDPPHTANLWWSEGVTSYYGDLLSERGGLNTRDEYLKHLSNTIGQLLNNPARLKVSADESSLRVWDANNSVGFGNLSYYTKGELVGLCLDLKIRQETAGIHSLDDVMKSLYTQVRHGAGPGFDEDDIKKTVNRVTGRNLSAFYDLLVRSTDELPFDECLGYAGLKLAKVDPPTIQGESGLRTQFDRSAAGLTVSEVTPGGAAESAGVKVGDKITSVNGSADRRGLGRALMSGKANEHVRLTISRGGSVLDIELVMGSRSVYNYSVSALPTASQAQIKLRDQWLGVK